MKASTVKLVFDLTVTFPFSIYFCGLFSKAGYNAGDGIHYYSVPGSMTESMLNLPQASNVGVPGQFVFRVDKKTTDGECISNQFVFKDRKPKDNYSKLLRIEYFIFIFLVLGVNLFYYTNM